MKILKFGLKKEEKEAHCVYCGCDFSYTPAETQLLQDPFYTYEHINCPQCQNKVYIGLK